MRSSTDLLLKTRSRLSLSFLHSSAYTVRMGLELRWPTLTPASVGQVKWGTPRSKNETEQWLKDATLFYRTIEQSYQLNLRLEFDLNVRLLPLVPSSPPPLPPFPAKNDWPIRRLLNETSAASSPPPLPTPPPSPSPPPWHSNDEACAASHFPVLYDREPVLRARALSGNGKVSPNVWLNVMQSFYHGLQELRTAHVPLDCVPPALRDQAAAEAVAQTIMETPPSNTSAGRKLLQNLAFDAGVLAELVQSALDARQLAVLDHQQALLKDLFVTAQKSLFGTASACARRPVLSSHPRPHLLPPQSSRLSSRSSSRSIPT